MANKLKSVFSNKEIAYKGSIRFQDKEMASDFNDALTSVFETGKTVRIDGKAAMSLELDGGSSLFPIEDHEEISDIIIGPSVEVRELPVEVDGEKQLISINTYSISNGFVIETSNDFPFALKMTFNRINESVNLKLTPHLDKAPNVEAALDSAKKIRELFKSFFVSDPDMQDDNLAYLKTIVEDSIDLLDKLLLIEKTVDVHFNTKEIDLKDNDSIKDLCELRFTLLEKKAIRVNAKMTSMESAEIELQEKQCIGLNKPLVLTFRSDVVYTIWGNAIKLHGAFYLGNVIAKKYEHLDNGKTRVIYGDNEAAPMYMSYKGFVTQKEVEDELKTLMDHKEDYENAKTVEQYLAAEETGLRF